MQQSRDGRRVRGDALVTTAPVHLSMRQDGAVEQCLAWREARPCGAPPRHTSHGHGNWLFHLRSMVIAKTWHRRTDRLSPSTARDCSISLTPDGADEFRWSSGWSDG